MNSHQNRPGSLATMHPQGSASTHHHSLSSTSENTGGEDYACCSPVPPIHTGLVLAILNRRCTCSSVPFYLCHCRRHLTPPEPNLHSDSSKKISLRTRVRSRSTSTIHKKTCPERPMCHWIQGLSRGAPHLELKYKHFNYPAL